MSSTAWISFLLGTGMYLLFFLISLFVTPLARHMQARLNLNIEQAQRAEIAKVAEANPADIQKIASTQMEIINSYYRSVLQQAQQSFQWALIAAAIGLAFLLAAISFSLLHQPTSVSIISLISGVIVDFISGANFYLYAQTSRQLTAFHSHLKETQRFLLANSVCENLEGELKQATRAELVRIIANMPAAPNREDVAEQKKITMLPHAQKQMLD